MKNMADSLHSDPEVAAAVRHIALEDFAGPGRIETAHQPNYAALRQTGSRIWLDTGDAGAATKAWGPEVEALTTNNTLVNQVIQTGAHDEFIKRSADRIRASAPGISASQMIMELGFLANAKLALGLVERFGVKVSVELHPSLGRDIEGTMVFSRRYFEICPDYFYVKVPLTPDGFVAVRRLSAQGIPVNYTLGFSARQNYLAARFSKPTFVNVFLGRLNQVVQENRLGDPENVGEKAALASDEVMKNLRASSPEASTQQIAASIRNGRQAAAVAGADVLTIPPKAAEEFLAMELDAGELQQKNWRDLHVNLNDRRLDVLWNVDKPFIEFVDDVLRQADKINCGEDLIRLSNNHEVGFFYSWQPDELALIRKKGKIPDVSRWPDAPIDDLMSTAALESFASDQSALDERIRRLAGYLP